MSLDLHQLYQQVILDHNRQPRNCRVVEGGRKADLSNPICGDHVTVHVRLEGDQIEDVSFQASGCAILKASASLMTEAVKGRTAADAAALVEQFEGMIAAPPGAPVDDLGALTALAGVRWFPVRLKCALLPWQALRVATMRPVR